MLDLDNDLELPILYDWFQRCRIWSFYFFGFHRLLCVEPFFCNSNPLINSSEFASIYFPSDLFFRVSWNTKGIDSTISILSISLIYRSPNGFFVHAQSRVFFSAVCLCLCMFSFEFFEAILLLSLSTPRKNCQSKSQLMNYSPMESQCQATVRGWQVRRLSPYCFRNAWNGFRCFSSSSDFQFAEFIQLNANGSISKKISQYTEYFYVWI